MEKYLQKDFKKALNSLTLEQGTSKEGSTYYYLNMAYNNGYSKRVFVNEESLFALRNAIDLISRDSVASDDFWQE